MRLSTRIVDKVSALGTVASVMGCGACFPAIASLGAAIGLGFLQEYEGLFISRLLPLYAAVAFIANALGWLRRPARTSHIGCTFLCIMAPRRNMSRNTQRPIPQIAIAVTQTTVHTLI